MGAAIAGGSTLARTAVALLVGGILLLAAVAGVVPTLVSGACADPDAAEAPPTASAERGIPANYLTLYQRAGTHFHVPWTVLAAIGSIESDHGRSGAPGVRSGVNAFGCCAGPMQFNVKDGPPSTWHAYRVDGDGDGDLDPYAPADAIATAGRYLRALLDRAHGDLEQAVYGYNHSSAYVADVLARAGTYGDSVESVPDTRFAGCSELGDAAAPPELQSAQEVTHPRAYATLPAWAMAGGRAAQPIDARLLDDALWLLRTYRLRVTAAREGGHNTHGDGTALDLVPAEPVDQAAWDKSAGALARALGWTPGCGRSGTRPACPLVRAMQFVGYEGYPGHGSPATCRGACAAHLHISWASPCYGSSAPSAPCARVTTFASASALGDGLP